MWDEDPAYADAYCQVIRQLLGVTVVAAVLVSIYVGDLEAIFFLARIGLMVGVVLAGYAAVVWLAGQLVLFFIRIFRRRSARSNENA